MEGKVSYSLSEIFVEYIANERFLNVVGDEKIVQEELLIENSLL